MSAATRPAVEAAMPPRLVLQLINPAIRAVLRSPLHRLLSRRLMILTVTGRTTGRAYSIPVGRHEADGLLLVSASGAWRHNLRGGAPVRVTIEGRDRVVRADLEEDPFEVAQTFKTLLDRVGVQQASALGLRVNTSTEPTVGDLTPAVAGRGIVRIRLADIVTS